MNDALEKFIREHRNEFDNYEPSPDLWKKIVLKEEPEKFVINRIWLKSVFRLAAILLIIFISVFVYEKFFDHDNIKNTMVDPEIASLNETEAYYNIEIKNKLAELEQYSPEFSDVKYDVINDLKELDSVAVTLKSDLGTNINNQEVVMNLIENYRLKLQILEDVLLQLKQAENIKINFNDKKNI